MKLSGNFLIASVMEALSEAMALIRKAGVDPHRYYDLLTSTLFTGPVFTNYGGLIARQEYKPAGFAAPLGEKTFGSPSPLRKRFASPCRWRAWSTTDYKR